MGKTRVAVITPGSLPVPPVLGGGIETVVYDYARNDQANTYLIVSALDGGLPATEIDVNGIQHFRIPNKSWHNFEIVWAHEYLIRWNAYIYKACQGLKQFDPEVIHVHNMPHWTPIIRKYFPLAKIILTNHNEKISQERYARQRLAKIAEAVDLFVYPSKKIAELDLAGQYQDKTRVIYNGVDTQYFKKASAKAIDYVRKKYNLGKRKVILFVGRLVAEKAVDKVLEALPYVLKEEKDAVLVIVGSSFFGKGQKTKYVQKLIDLAEPYKEQVVFTGFVDTADVPVLYSLAEVFVSPVNWDDPSPKTIYEAAACQATILSTKRGGIPEIVRDGDSALLLDSPYETEELSGAIIDLLREPDTRELLGQNARARIEKNFTVERIAKQWSALYQEIMPHPRPLSNFGEGWGQGVGVRPRLLTICPVFVNQSETFIYAMLQKQKSFATRVLCYDRRNLDVFNYPSEQVFGLRGQIFTEVMLFLNLPNKCFSWLKDFEPDVIHAQFLPSLRLANAVKKFFGGRPKVVLHIHGQDLFIPEKQNKMKTIAADLILTPSEYVANQVRKYTKSPVRCYYTAIEDDFVYADPQPLGKEIKLMMLGRMVEKKGYEYAIQALAKLGQGYRLDLVGTGPLKPKLQELAKDLNVHFHEIKDNQKVRQMLADTDIFLAPSVTATNGDREGLPRTVTEALALGTPVIATTHSGIPEAIIHQQTGLLVPERDVDSLAQSIEWAGQNWPKMVKYAKSGRAHFDALFGTKRTKKLSQEFCSPLKEFLINLEG